MKQDSLAFACREVDWELWIESDVLDHFAKHRQMESHAPEVGGQLFATFEKYRVRILRATGPREADRRSRFSFFPDRRLENFEIKERFTAGLHFIGDWHTHPERKPSPSSVDLESMSDCFRRSKHSLSHFVMIIVGQDEAPAGLWVSVHDGKKHSAMKPMFSATRSPGALAINHSSSASFTSSETAKMAGLSKRTFAAIKKAFPSKKSRR